MKIYQEYKQHLAHEYKRLKKELDEENETSLFFYYEKPKLYDRLQIRLRALLWTIFSH